jgi:hypothetical protein
VPSTLMPQAGDRQVLVSAMGPLLGWGGGYTLR